MSTGGSDINFVNDVNVMHDQMKKYKRMFITTVMRRYKLTEYQAEIKYTEVMNAALRGVFKQLRIMSTGGSETRKPRYEVYMQLQGEDSRIVWDNRYRRKLKPKEVVKLLNESVLAAADTEGWISVKERLPEEGVDVSVYCLDYNQSGFSVAYWKNKSTGARTGIRWFPDDGNSDITEYITHWMPLPEHPALYKASPPKQNEK